MKTENMPEQSWKVAQSLHVSTGSFPSYLEMLARNFQVTDVRLSSLKVSGLKAQQTKTSNSKMSTLG